MLLGTCTCNKILDKNSKEMCPFLLTLSKMLLHSNIVIIGPHCINNELLRLHYESIIKLAKI
jgi:hypothetical protein